MPNCFDSVRCEMGTADYQQYGEPLIYRYHSSNRPQLAFYATPEEVSGDDWRKRLYFGVELEFDSNDWCVQRRTNRISTIGDCNIIMRSDTYGYFMNDGSLNGGMEFITQPSTYDFYISNRSKFEQLFEKIKEHGYHADDVTTPGFHIHFNRDFYADDEKKYLENLLFAIDRYWPYLVYCSKRRVSSINKWSKKYSATPHEIVEDMECGYIPDRYHVLNLRNSSTFEFRLWHGTLDAPTFYSVLTLVKNLVILAKTSSKEEISKLPFEFLLSNPEMAKFWLDVSRRRVTRKYDTFLKE